MRLRELGQLVRPGNRRLDDCRRIPAQQRRLSLARIWILGGSLRFLASIMGFGWNSWCTNRRQSTLGFGFWNIRRCLSFFLRDNLVWDSGSLKLRHIQKSWTMQLFLWVPSFFLYGSVLWLWDLPRRVPNVITWRDFFLAKCGITSAKTFFPDDDHYIIIQAHK